LGEGNLPFRSFNINSLVAPEPGDGGAFGFSPALSPSIAVNRPQSLSIALKKTLPRRLALPRAAGWNNFCGHNLCWELFMDKTAELKLDGKAWKLPVVEGTEKERAIDISSLRDETGYITLDDGYGNTGACQSQITF